jgi:hypothetical protein
VAHHERYFTASVCGISNQYDVLSEHSLRGARAQRAAVFRFNTQHFGLMRCVLGRLLARVMRAKDGCIPLQYAAFRADEMIERALF